MISKHETANVVLEKVPRVYLPAKSAPARLGPFVDTATPRANAVDAPRRSRVGFGEAPRFVLRIGQTPLARAYGTTRDALTPTGSHNRASGERGPCGAVVRTATGGRC